MERFFLVGMASLVHRIAKFKIFFGKLDRPEDQTEVSFGKDFEITAENKTLERLNETLVSLLYLYSGRIAGLCQYSLISKDA